MLLLQLRLQYRRHRRCPDVPDTVTAKHTSPVQFTNLVPKESSDSPNKISEPIAKKPKLAGDMESTESLQTKEKTEILQSVEKPMDQVHVQKIEKIQTVQKPDELQTENLIPSSVEKAQVESEQVKIVRPVKQLQASKVTKRAQFLAMAQQKKVQIVNRSDSKKIGVMKKEKIFKMFEKKRPRSNIIKAAAKVHSNSGMYIYHSFHQQV